MDQPLPHLRWVLLRIVAVVCVILVVGLVAGVVEFSVRWGYKSPGVIEWMHAGFVGGALLAYAGEHKGEFPHTLADLPAEAIRPDSRRFHDPDTKQEADWVYYGGYSFAAPGDDEDRKKTIILASPRMVRGHQRIVFHAGGSGTIIEENAFVLQLAKQLSCRLKNQ